MPNLKGKNMAYTAQTQYTSSNFTPAAQVPDVFGMPRTISGITIHHWGSNGQDFDNVRNWLCTNNTPTSAHYIAQAGLVACIVDPANAAWHAGNPRGNATTIGIECRPEATDADYETVAELIRELRAAYGDLPLYPHKYWTSTACPGNWDLARLDALARGTVTQPPAIVPPTPDVVTPQPSSEDIQWLVESGETLSQVAAYYNGPSAEEIAVAKGIADPNAIQVGQVLTIPGPLQWVVDPGDTLSSIAAYYHVSPDYIAQRNGIKNLNYIPAGQVLTIK